MSCRGIKREPLAGIKKRSDGWFRLAYPGGVTWRPPTAKPPVDAGIGVISALAKPAVAARASTEGAWARPLAGMLVRPPAVA